MQLIASLVPTLIFLLAVFIGIAIPKTKIGLNYFLLFVIAVSYSLLLNLPRNYASLQFTNSRWNWSGKIFALLFSVLCIYVLKNKLPKDKVGLTSVFKPGSFKERTVNLIFPTIAHFGTEMMLTTMIVLFF